MLSQSELPIGPHYGSIVGEDDAVDEIGVGKSSGASLSQRAVMINVISGLLGVSLFAVPWGFEQSGVIGGVIITSVVAYLSYVTAWSLLLAQKSIFDRNGSILSYPEIAAEILDVDIWSSVVSVATVVSCLGGCVGYLIFLGQLCELLFHITFRQAVCLLLCPLVLLSWIRTFRELTAFSIFGNVSMIFSLLSIFVCGVYQAHGADLSSTPILVPKTIFNYLGPATFLFTIHYCVLSIGAEFLQRQKEVLAAAGPVEKADTTEDLQDLGLPIAAVQDLGGSVGRAYTFSSIVIVMHGVAALALYHSSGLVTYVIRDTLYHTAQLSSQSQQLSILSFEPHSVFIDVFISNPFSGIYMGKFCPDVTMQYVKT